MFSKTVKIISFLTATITPIILNHYLIRRFKKLIESYAQVDNADYKAIFITEKNRDCKPHIYQRNACSETCSYNYLTMILKFIESAEHSISLCILLLTCTEVQDALIRAHNRSVQVRFISDARMVRVVAARVKFLQGAGISLKIQPDQGTLHHKFCLVDENHPIKAKVFFGSLNLTVQGLTSNWDLIIFTNDQNVIKKYHDEFEYLWNNFIDCT